MNEIIGIIDETGANIKQITELFYQNNEQQALGIMPVLLDNILKVTGALDICENISEEDKNEMLKILTEALNAMEEKDYVLLADILQYDMMDVLTGFKEMFAN